MNPLMLIKGELRRSFRGILALALVLALSLSLGVGVSMTERAVRQGTARAGDAFDLLVGAQGSSVQLMLGAVYLRPQSLPLVPGGAVTEILTQEGVVWAAPLAFGDRWNASPLVGTTTDMVTLGGNRTLAEGRAFAAQDEAVLGAGVPLRSERRFPPCTGRSPHPTTNTDMSATKARRPPCPETGTPWDNAILIPIESVWAVHDALPDAGHALPLGHLFEGKGSPLPGVSAVVVKPESIAAAYRLRAFWQTATLPDADGRPVNMQGVFTGEVLTELFATLGDHARHHDRHGLCRAVRGPVRGHAGRRDGGIHAQTDARHAACARCAARLSGAQRLVRGQRQHRRGHAGGPAVRLWPFRRCGAAHVPPDRDHALPATYPRRRFLCRSFLRARLLVRAVPRLYGLPQDGSRRIGG